MRGAVTVGMWASGNGKARPGVKLQTRHGDSVGGLCVGGLLQLGKPADQRRRARVQPCDDAPHPGRSARAENMDLLGRGTSSMEREVSAAAVRAVGADARVCAA